MKTTFILALTAALSLYTCLEIGAGEAKRKNLYSRQVSKPQPKK